MIIGCRPNAEAVVDVPTAVWSSTDERSSSPESAAIAAVDELLGITPVISDFMAGDARSGEINVFSAGDTPMLVDQAVVTAGSLGELEPFTTRLDLRQTTKGDVIAIVVRADTGSEDDPGEFSAIPIRIGF